MRSRRDFPSAAERARILARREQLLDKMGPVLAQAVTLGLEAVKPESMGLGPSYTIEDVNAVFRLIGTRMRRNQSEMRMSPAEQDAHRYRHYVRCPPE